MFPDEGLAEASYAKGSMLLNETYSFQVAFCSVQLLKGIKIRIESPLDQYVLVRSVGVVPSELPTYHDYDENVLRTLPGLYPDPLYPLFETEGINALPGQWRAIWITVDPEGNAEPGLYDIHIFVESDEGVMLGEETFEVYGREYVLDALEEGLERPISFRSYPIEASWLLSKREWINKKIKERFQVCK